MIPSRSLHRLAPLCRHLPVALVKPGYHLSHCPNFWSPLSYPGKPAEIAQTIKSAINSFNSNSSTYFLEGWEKNDTSGIPLNAPIFTKIANAAFLAADITYLNENVVFEIGYAIGLKKRVLLLVNSAHIGDRQLASAVGIFDTLGYESYETSHVLSTLLTVRKHFTPIDFEVRTNHQQPVYIVEPLKRNDAQVMLVSRTKKARWKFRSFNPDEDVRLSAMDAIRHVAQSAGVIAPLQPTFIENSKEHNIRSLFVAGLALALEIPTLIIHPSEFSPPLDIRDLTKKYHHPDDIKDAIQDFSLEITEYGQLGRSTTASTQTVLTKLSIGDPTAENEMTTLSDYYLFTDEYQRASRGEVNLVVGRKGSGKTALFVQLRDVKREKKPNIVVDLKPEGFQLVKLKERVLDFLTAGAQEHLITAMWEYILLLEITYKVLEKDRHIFLNNHKLTAPYSTLKSIYGNTELSREGDFRERLTKLADRLIDEFFSKFDPTTEEKKASPFSMTTSQVTEILYQHDLHTLFSALKTYLRLKDEVWLLFDNIDKGWNVEGISNADIIILRCLLNASRKIEQELNNDGIKFHAIVFVRDDVYSVLMQGSADYGKEMRASLDWSDIDLLGEVLKRRIMFSLGNTIPEDQHADTLSQICISHYSGEPWLSFMAGRSLMRPRNLLKLFRYSLGYAINMQHPRIETEDITRGLVTYAQDLVIEVDRELSDVFPKARKLIYEFSEENSAFSEDELSTLIQCTGLDEMEAGRVINFLLYYGVLGVKRPDEETLYIYNVNYDLEMLLVRIRKWQHSTKYILNPALWPALKVKE